MRILIVGAGIAGLASAWALAKCGHETVLFEQGPLPNPLSASGDHHRIIRRAYGPDSGYGHAIDEAFDAWNELWDDLGSSHYDHRGFMAVSREAGDEAEDYLSGMVAGGFSHELFDPAEACRKWPFLERDSFRFAFYSSDGGVLHCRAIANGLARWLRANGVELALKTRVASIEPAAASVKLQDGSSVSGDLVIVTAGAWVTKLFPELSVRLRPMRTAVVYLDPPSDLKSAWEKAPVILDVGGKTDGYIIPPSGGGGLKFGSGLHKEDNPDADSRRSPLPGEGQEVRDLFSSPIARIGDYRILDTVTCAYTFTADERFFCQEIGKTMVISACSGHGYKFGAAIGRRVAEWAATGDTTLFRQWLRAEQQKTAG